MSEKKSVEPSWGHVRIFRTVPCRPHTPWYDGWVRAPSPAARQGSAKHEAGSPRQA